MKWHAWLPHGREISGSAAPIYIVMVTDSLAILLVVASLGRYEVAALAAFTFASGVYAPASAVVMGTLKGVVPFVAPYRDDAAASLPILRDCRWLALSVGVLAGAVLLCLPQIAGLLGIGSAIRAEFGMLPLLLAAGVLVGAVGEGAVTALIAIDRSKDVLWPGLLETALIVVLGPVMILGFGPVPAMGLEGAGIVLLLASLSSATIANWRLRRFSGAIGWHRPRPAHVVELVRVGVPLAGTSLVKYGALGFLSTMSARLGLVEAAAYGVLVSLVNFVKYGAVAIGHATTPIIARAARDDDATLAKRTALTAAVIMCLPLVAFGLLLFTLGGWLAPLTADSEAVQVLMLAMIPWAVAAAFAEGLLAAPNAGLVAVKRTDIAFRSYACCYAAMGVAVVPAAGQFGLVMLFMVPALANSVLLAWQSWRFLEDQRWAVAEGTTA